MLVISNFLAIPTQPCMQLIKKLPMQYGKMWIAKNSKWNLENHQQEEYKRWTGIKQTVNTYLLSSNTLVGKVFIPISLAKVTLWYCSLKIEDQFNSLCTHKNMPRQRGAMALYRRLNCCSVEAAAKIYFYDEYLLCLRHWFPGKKEWPLKSSLVWKVLLWTKISLN